MSQASKSLKKIATSEDYKSLVTAIEAKDYETISKSYLRLCQLLEEEKKQVLAKIQSLPRQNRGEDCEQFQTAFTLRASVTLPQWHWLTSQMKEAGVTEGEVFGFGSRGDPLVRTAQGRVVVISGVALEKGAKIKFKVITEGQKLDFGRPVELNADYFGFLLNREARESMKKSFEAVEERLRNGPPPELDEAGLARLSELLKGLEDVRQLTSKLGSTEKDGAVARVQMYRKRLLDGCGVKMALDFMSRAEENEIAEACGGDEQQILRALSAPGLFRYESHLKLKAGLLAGKDLKGYKQILEDLESRLDSMNAALELMEFQSGVEKMSPAAKAYLERMDGLFERLHRKARQVTLALAEGTLFGSEDIKAAVREAFSGGALGAELRRTFLEAEEFYALRGALADLRAKLDDKASLPAEAALRPYLTRKIAGAFQSS